MRRAADPAIAQASYAFPRGSSPFGAKGSFKLSESGPFAPDNGLKADITSIQLRGHFRTHACQPAAYVQCSEHLNGRSKSQATASRLGCSV
jgi:hypothetical protein